MSPLIVAKETTGELSLNGGETDQNHALETRHFS
jgi:hypothetical protein